MATKKPAAKVAAKKPVAKKVALPAKKAAPAKKATPAKKVVPAKKAVSAKKVVPAKKVAPVKKVVTKKPVAKVVASKVAKPLAKKAVAKVPAKPAVKVVAKPVVKKVIASKIQIKPVAKKIETKKVEVKVAPVKATAKPTAKEPVPDHIKALKKAMAIKSAAEKAKAPKPEPKKPLVMPKISTKTARKYEPDFTKSVLDKAPVDRGAAIVMYSDADLMEFKELIQRKLGSAKKELAYLQGLITRKDDTGGDDSDGRYMTMEDGSLSMEREQLSQMASRQITFVDHLEKALMRIENKTYGVCRVTGKLIDKARLRAVPHATLSIEAKMSGGK
jgi:RNA polymerase-binding transcription factor DksA